MVPKRVWKGCAAGLAGGLAATLVMTGFQSVWNAAAPKLSNGNGAREDESKQEAGTDEGRQKKSENENPTEKVAQKIMESGGVQLTTESKKIAGTVVHYAFGTLMGALYGTALEFAPRTYRRNAVGSGMLWGGTLFAAADEIALPALHLTPTPDEIPAPMHAYGLLSHLVYGATAGLVTRTLRDKM
jgi:uncharacterized membrane protein YagU involved in acid resistance